jgi:hypothetical protein
MDIPDHWIPQPTFHLDASTVEHLEDVFTRLVGPGRNAWIEGPLPVPIWQFLC